MIVSHRSGSLRSARTDALVFLAPAGHSPMNAALAPLRKALGAKLGRILDLEGFTGKAATHCTFLSDGKLPAPRVIVAGLGDRGRVTAESFRRAAALAALAAQGKKLKRIVYVLPPAPKEAEGWPEGPVAARSIAEGAILGTYRYDRYRTGDARKKRTLVGAEILSADDHDRAAIRKALREAAVVCDAVCFARDLENAPPNEIYPETLAAAARASGAKHGFRVTVWDERRLKQTGFGGLLAVGGGSDRPPRFIVMEHNASAKAMETLVLVGKGVTFDAGGISIKPASGMAEMKMDMSGAAAVIATMQAAARLDLPVRLVGLVPTAENLLGGSAMRPGDIIVHYGGTTSEVDNTDAEGRLILADALAWARTLKPAAVVDLATLTGACVVALGAHATGMMGNDEVLMAELKAAGERTFERVWPLPLFEEYERQIRSDVADVKNVGGRWAGAITAGLFLKRFVGDGPWTHLDIAGTAILEESQPYAPKGGSGVGVRLLVDWLTARAAS